MAVLLLASVLIVKRLNTQQSRHVELREAFILLHMRGYTNHAQRLYEYLLRDLQNIRNRELMDDFQRTLLVVDPASHQPENLLWKYHWTVSNELERRSESTLLRALEIANETKQER